MGCGGGGVIALECEEGKVSSGEAEDCNERIDGTNRVGRVERSLEGVMDREELGESGTKGRSALKWM